MRGHTTVIWDWNGTLLDDVDLCVEIANEMLTDYDLRPLTVSQYRDIFDFPVATYWERAGLDIASVDFSRLSAEFCSRFESRLDRASLFPAATRTIEMLHRSGVRQFLLSGTEHATLERMVRRYGLSGAFDGIQGMSNTLAEGKTNGGRRLFGEFQLNPAQTVLVGDTIHDAEVARDLRASCRLVASGHQALHRLARLGHPVFPSLETLAG